MMQAYSLLWRTWHNIVDIHKVYHNMYSNKVHQKKDLKVIPRAFNKSLPGILPHLFRVFRSSHCHTYYGMTGLDRFIIQFFLVGGSPLPENFWSIGISTKQLALLVEPLKTSKVRFNSPRNRFQFPRWPDGL